MYCTDASVITNSQIEHEEFHEYSKKLMQIIKDREIIVVIPEIALPEIASALVRGTDSAEKALTFVDELKQLPNFIFIPIDRELAELASKFAAEHRLRGCDAIYVAVASLFNAKLISLDKQQRERASDCIDALTPQEELENL
ncbi:MAG: type II toxin-antitoxin system VapC family toxin [Halobacteriota archaeon]